MAVSDILISIDRDIAQLQQARALLDGTAAPAAKRSPGRLKKAAGKTRKIGTSAAPGVPKSVEKKKRNLSPEGRKRIAEAVKKRWAKQKRAEAAAAK